MTWTVTFELAAAVILISMAGLIHFCRAGADLDRRFGADPSAPREAPAKHP